MKIVGINYTLIVLNKKVERLESNKRRRGKQWAHEKKNDYGDKDGGCTWAQQHGLLLIHAHLAIVSAQVVSSRDQHWVPSKAPFHGVIAPLASND